MTNQSTPSAECKYCYGKGYSSVMFDEIGSPDLESKGYVTRRKEIRKPCRCQNEPSTTCPICEDEKCHWDCGEDELITSDDLVSDIVMSWEYMKGLIEGLKETDLNQITAISELSDYIEHQHATIEKQREALEEIKNYECECPSSCECACISSIANEALNQFPSR